MDHELEHLKAPTGRSGESRACDLLSVVDLLVSTQGIQQNKAKVLRLSLLVCGSVTRQHACSCDHDERRGLHEHRARGNMKTNPANSKLESQTAATSKRPINHGGGIINMPLLRFMDLMIIGNIYL